jgi:hypothetical protein
VELITLKLTPESADDAQFIGLVDELISGAVAIHQPAEVLVLKIDHWFDHKWLGFSGKVVGAVGSWRKQLTLPPFVANRVVDQRRFVRNDAVGRYEISGQVPGVHHEGPSAANLRRTVKQVVPDAALFWYSGDTAATGRGSLMGYVPVEQDHWPWFIAFSRAGDWRIARRKGIHEYEVRMFKESGIKV